MSWPIKRGDREPRYTGQLLVDGAPVNLTGKTVRFLMKYAKTNVVKVDAIATIDNALEGRVSHAWGPTDTDTSDLFKAEWEVTSGGLKRTFPAEGWLYIQVYEDVA